jgi:glyceraldehyde-3-phosphate dehydrogenase (NAD(P))
MKVLVNGLGNIGQTILGVLCDYKSVLNITEIYALKNTAITAWNISEIERIEKKGVTICAKNNSSYKDIDSVIDKIDYLFDCNANSFGLKNKEWYASLKNLKGCSTQGSEKGFGMPFMTGINNKVIENEKFVQIVSCNTHALSAIITTFSNADLSNFLEGDFVIVRRSEDLGNSERLVGANVLSRHLDDEIGTHHAIDVKDLFNTKNKALNIQSSDITTPSQLMHAVRFNLKFNNSPKLAEIENSIEKNSCVSSTAKFDSNIIFELGRRYSQYGRLFSHAIINSNNLLFDFKNDRIKGWAFIPQEGNTILSTIHAFLIQINSKDKEKVIAKLTLEMIKPTW